MTEICIRLCDTEKEFVYTLRRGGEVIESEAVSVAETDCEYYGGSEVMD